MPEPIWMRSVLAARYPIWLMASKLYAWATHSALDVAAASAPTLTIADVDEALTALAATSGAGSASARAGLLVDVFGRATDAEVSFLHRLLVGELRQGALEGVMTDAVAKA